MKRILIILAALAGSSCASKPVLTFPYKWYYYDSPAALAEKPGEDIPLFECLPTPIEHPCIIMKKDEFERLYLDYLMK